MMNIDSEKYIILVYFDLKPGHRSDFMPLMLENAQKSKADEPGCLVFDVLCRTDDPDRIVLYEIYENRAAFDAHLASPHFLSFDKAAYQHVEKKSVIELNLEYT